MIYKKIDNCRICFSQDLEIVFDLGQFYSCGNFPELRSPNDVPIAPLCLSRCTACGLVQLNHNYNQDNLFRNTYGYRSGLNSSMVDHLASIVEKLTNLISLSSGDYVLDIGSNDATLLKFYNTPNLFRVGIDPSIQQFRDFYPSDIQTSADFFTAKTFQNIAGDHKARIITSISMFYDLEEPNVFVSDIAKVLHPEGIWVLEQSYLPTMLSKNSFDTICHEHLEYYALSQITMLLSRHDLRVMDVELNNVNGGSFRLYVCHENSSCISNLATVEKLLLEEKKLGLDTKIPFENFWLRIEQIKNNLLEFLLNCKKAGKRVHGYGASTKGNTLLQYFGITSELVEMIADCNTTKWGCCTPGTCIPIVSEKISRDLKPDYYLVLPWHFRDNFLSREKDFIESGGIFIFPLPQFELVNCKMESLVAV